MNGKNDTPSFDVLFFNLTLKSMSSGHGQSSKALPFERLIATP
jgi:hypothetical protein